MKENEVEFAGSGGDERLDVDKSRVTEASVRAGKKLDFDIEESW